MQDILKLVNSKHLPPNFPRDFDAHIYFESSTREIAQKLKLKLEESFKDKQVFVGFLIDAPIGPHPKPMFECNFPIELFQDVVLFLMNEREGLDILVHPLSDDDYKDHTALAMWLGQSVELKLDIF